jgi:hypothetical protein
MFTPPFRAVLLKSVGLAILLLILLGVGLHRLFGWLAGIGEGCISRAGMQTPLHILIWVLAIAAGFDSRPVRSSSPATACCELLLRRDRRRGRARALSGDRRAWQCRSGPPGWASRPLLALVVYLIAVPFSCSPESDPDLFVANTFLLGREYFLLTAMRFHSVEDAKRLRTFPRHRDAGRHFIAAFIVDPGLNLATPLFGMAFMTRAQAHRRAAVGCGVTPQALANYANALAFFPFPQVRPVPSFRNAGDKGRVDLVDKYEDLGLVPRGAEANSDLLTGAVAAELGGTGYFNCIVDADGVVRRIALATPFGLDPDRANWDMYASIDVQALRLYLGLPNQQTILWYSRNGVASVEFGPKSIVHPDDVSRLMVNFHSPARTYPYVSFASAQKNSRHIQRGDRSGRRLCHWHW